MAEPIDIDKHIALLERRLAREKNARLEAEALLMEKSREIYQANIELQDALAVSEQKREELAFLAQSSGALTNSQNSENLLANVTQLSANFLKSDLAITSVQLKDCMAFDPHTPLYSQQKRWFNHPDTIAAINQVLADAAATLSDWQVVPFHHGDKRQHMLLRSVSIDSESQLISAFVLNKPPASSEAYSVLTIMFGQLKQLLLARKSGAQAEGMTGLDFEVLQEQLSKARTQLEQSEKMASLGQLAAGVAHEINNPVGFVRSNLETLEQYLEDLLAFVAALDPKASEINALKDEYDIAFLLEDTQDIITTNLGGLDRISEIVQGLKSFSHQGDSEARQVDLVHVVQAALSVANNELKYKHTVVNQLPDTPLNTMGKAGQLQQVFINLFVNASHAMADGGTLTITAQQSDSDIVIAVTDTGSGMSQDTQQQLFNPFYTTKAVGEGTGLGLSISYSIIEAHYGKIWVKSALGEGTTFYVSFPLAAASQPPTAE